MIEILWAARADAEAVAERVVSVIARPGRKSIAVPGGRTPIPVLERLSRQSLPWEMVDVTLTDERLVPVTHAASNFGRLSAALGSTGARLHPLVEGARVGPFDLVWIGMGTDGHIASLFSRSPIDPDAPAQVVRTCPDPLPPEAPYERLTLTLSALTATRDLILFAQGDAKRAVLEAAMAGTVDLPITRLLKAARCPVTIFWSQM